MSTNERFLVTGAGGFIGGWLSEALCLEDPEQVTAAVHSWSGAARLARFPMRIVALDVLDEERVAAAMDGVTHVIHCAYGNARVTVEGTRNLLAEAYRRGAQRFVYLSTAEVYGSPTGEVDETAPVQGNGEYAEEKILAEALCWEYGEKGLPVTVIRPTIVYGPFGREWTVKLAQRLLSGNWGILKEHGDGYCCPVYVTDLVRGILLAARQDAAVGQAFNLAGSEVTTWNDVWRRYAVALGMGELPVTELGTKVRLLDAVRPMAKTVLGRFRAPIQAVYYRSRLARKVMKSFETSMTTTPRLADMSLFDRKAVYSWDKATRLLQYRPTVPLDHGLSLSAAWLRHVGLLE